MRRLFLLFFLFPIMCCSCPDGFDIVAAGECRMKTPIRMEIRDDQATDAAISQCKTFQSQPVIIHNDEQQTYWTEKRKKTRDGWLTLGLVCNTKTQKWQWADGSPVDYRPPGYHYYDLDTNCKSGCAWIIGSDDGFWADLCRTNVETYYVYCTTQLELPIPSADGCENFEDDSEDGICYQVRATAENWKEAQIICGSFGAQVASIHNEKENSFLRRIAVSKGAISGIYLGASISANGSDFAWMDGSKWDYDKFYPGFPVNGLGECLIMDTGGSSGNWANVDCSSKMSVACERNQGYLAPACQQGPFEEGQIIYSPGFPFDATSPCDYIITVDEGKKIELEVLLVEANTCCDHLLVYENYFGYNVIANLTGNINDKKYTTDSSNFMRISWQPTDGKNVRGVMFTYKAV